jgi:hypothetical protein
VSHTTPINFKRPFRDIPRGDKRTESKDIPSNGEVDSVAVNVFFLFQLPSMRIPPLSAIASPTNTQSGVLQHRHLAFLWSTYFSHDVTTAYFTILGVSGLASLTGASGFCFSFISLRRGAGRGSPIGICFWQYILDKGAGFVLAWCVCAGGFRQKINRLSFSPFKLHSPIGRREPCES